MVADLMFSLLVWDMETISADLFIHDNSNGRGEMVTLLFSAQSQQLWVVSEWTSRSNLTSVSSVEGSLGIVLKRFQMRSRSTQVYLAFSCAFHTTAA